MPEKKTRDPKLDIWQSILDILEIESFWQLENLLKLRHGYIYNCRYKENFPRSMFYRFISMTELDAKVLVSLYDDFAEAKGIPKMEGHPETEVGLVEDLPTGC